MSETVDWINQSGNTVFCRYWVSHRNFHESRDGKAPRTTMIGAKRFDFHAGIVKPIRGGFIRSASNGFTGYFRSQVVAPIFEYNLNTFIIFRPVITVFRLECSEQR